ICAKRGKATKAVLIDGLGGPATYFKGNGLKAAGKRLDAGNCIGGLGIDCRKHDSQILRPLGKFFSVTGSEPGILYIVRRLLFPGLGGDA
ncbi:hypothetical protein BGZ47_004348, partial [Haplosporangium gracile]